MPGEGWQRLAWAGGRGRGSGTRDPSHQPCLQGRCGLGTHPYAREAALPEAAVVGMRKALEPVRWAQSGLSWPVFLCPGEGGPGTVGGRASREQATHSDVDLCAHSTAGRAGGVARDGQEGACGHGHGVTRGAQ